jgi:uncharacterized protein (TIGR02646 family)
MRRLVRRKLSAATTTYLDSQTALVLAEPPSGQKALAKRLWKQAGKTKAFDEVRAVLQTMASGLRRCMYCEDSRGVAIDHFWPLSRYPRRAFRWHNYLYACTYCNSNEKRDQFPIEPITRRPLLVKPTREDPSAHLVFAPSTGMFRPRSSSPKGEPTIRVFGLNLRPELPVGRHDAFTALQSLLVDYADQRRKGLDAQADKIKSAVKNHPFSAVFVYLVQIAAKASGAPLLRPECLAALDAYPEIKTWTR